MLGHRARDLVLGLVDVAVDRAVEFGRQRGDLAEGAVRHRVGRMGREAEREQRVVPVAVPQREPLGQVIVGVGGVGGREVDDDHAKCRTHAALQRGFGRRFRVEVHVVEAGDPAAQHFHAGELRPIPHELG